MLKFIAQSSAQYPLGIPPGRKCLALPSGPYAGRTAVLYAASASAIKLVSTDAPYTTFATPIDVVDDAADTPFDAFMASGGDIYVAYIVTVTNDLAFVKLTFANGAWTAGAKVTVFTADDCSRPTICRLTTNQLWIVYTRLNGGQYHISAKMSLYDGENWGTITDPGDTLVSGVSAACAAMVEQNLRQYVFYTVEGNKLAYRYKGNGGILWESETTLASGSGFDDRLSAAVSGDGRIGVGYVNSSGLRFREYSGSTWSAEMAIESGALSAPGVAYRGGDAFVIFTRDSSDQRRTLMVSHKEAGGFSTPVVLDTRKADLKKLLVYHAGAGTYQDKTEQAASETSGDILHSVSGGLLDDVGDALYLGQDEPFNAVYFRLSTSGAGGEVIWKYWDGQGWKAFSPASGTWHFSSADQDMILWSDYSSLPVDWQKREISGHTCYWIAVTVTTAFTTSPVGSRITAVSDLRACSTQGCL